MSNEEEMSEHMDDLSDLFDLDDLGDLSDMEGMFGCMSETPEHIAQFSLAMDLANDAVLAEKSGDPDLIAKTRAAVLDIVDKMISDGGCLAA